MVPYMLLLTFTTSSSTEIRALPRYGMEKIDGFIWIARPGPRTCALSVRTAHQLLLILILFPRLYRNIRLLFGSESQRYTINERRKLPKL